MQIDPEQPTIILKVEVYGEKESRTMDMALDTGSTYVMVPWHIAESLGYDPAVSRRRINLTTASSVVVAPIMTVKAMKTLGQQVSNVDVVCHDLPPGSRVEGLLGLSYLKNFDLDLHYKKLNLELRDP
jgi:predicted aspartyl protease